ncbi:nitrilase family protein [Paenactinomyces guangxiensis]|uniref:Hydratase n=1 Tax=Paenactinomyces guangxiensis TaxID=1490290 RepID=A0A7W2A7W3_9BACL|nr:nitrilase-related carbon-nitrogen hydrolase [Paenactinomyces guangxiensis]MBA4493532.1 hydratase [Paenactinomyces guangxiensis]
MSEQMHESPVKVAVVQMDPQVGLENKAKNVQMTLDYINQAASNGAKLIVLPELCNTGYSFQTREEAFAHAEPVPNGKTVETWVAIANERNVYLVAGITELDGNYLYDSAVLIGPEGYIGKYRKAHLWYKEKLFFTPGDTGFPVFETKMGRIGLLICWDIWFPEVARILSMQGADIICSCNNWVWTPPPLFDETGKCMASYLTMTAAHSNNLFIAAANRVGEERGGKFLGCSLIAGNNGWPITGPASPEEETILYADINLVSSRQAPIWNELNDLIRDRRTDLYNEMLGYQLGKKLPR